MTTEDDVNLSVLGICGFLFHLKNYMYLVDQTKVIKKEIEGTGSSVRYAIQEMSVVVERSCILSVQVFLL